MNSNPSKNRFSPMENLLERVLFGGRWLMAPMYLGLLLSLAVLLVRFIHDFIDLASVIWSESSQNIALGVLGLLDTTLLGNLIVLMIFAGYENFVSKINVAKHSEDRPAWMGKVDYSGLKMKLIGSLVAISVIELLKDFVEASHDLLPQVIKYRIAIHLTFVVSGLIFAIMDYVADKRLVMDKAAHIPEH
ncbi:MAG: TIGR00645 family protein [Actinomycetes bacterium]